VTHEEPLLGGNVSPGIVKVGDTVRKPETPATPAIEAYLRHLATAGFDAAPRTFGRDDRGRLVLEFVPGSTAMEQPPLALPELRRLGALVRRLHDASAGFVPPPGARWQAHIPADGADLICHHDLAPWNLVRDGDRWVFIDWDAAAPGTRLWDLAYVAQTFAPLQAGGDPAADAPRLRAVVDGYDLDADARRRLPAVLAARTRAMYDLLRRAARTGEQPWHRLWHTGHGEYWGHAADYVDAHRPTWTAALS
jgi:hypothetical protein